jgi:heme-degrading monooxygenase HmoA
LPGLVSIEVMRSEEDFEELAITRWQSPKGFRPGGAFGRVCQVLPA